MKTQIITLETHDDLISVRDRMSWAKSPRILLVWPKYEKIILRPVDLRVLQNHARSLGADLGLVTRRANVRRDAQGFGIPVFESSAAAQREAWPAREPAAGRRHRTGPPPDLRLLRDRARVQEAGWRSNPLARFGFFALGVAAVLAIAALFVPRATLRLMPFTQPQSITIPVSASRDFKEVQITGDLPAHETGVIAELKQSMTVVSQGAVPGEKARGIARFKNLTQSGISIPARTVLLSGGAQPLRFLTVNDTHLPGKVNAFVEVPIEAEEGGEAGNLPADTIQSIAGELSLSLSVTNPDPTGGGTDMTATAAAEADRKYLRNLLAAAVDLQARQKIQAGLSPEDMILLNTIQPVQVLEESYDPPQGQAGPLLTLSLRIEYQAQYVSGDDLRQLAETALNASVPPGFSVTPNSLSYGALNPPVMDASGTTHFDLKAGQTIARQVEPLKAILLVRGIPVQAAVQVLQSNLPLAAPPEIVISPAWWPWMPLIPFRISVE